MSSTTTDSLPDDLPSNPESSYDPLKTQAVIQEMLGRLPSDSKGALPGLESEEKDSSSSQEMPTKEAPKEVLESAWREVTSGPAHSVSEFILRRMVGSGGFGEVWEAVQTSLSRTVAVKRLRRSIYGKDVSTSQIRFHEMGFQREGLIVARLEHPNINPIYDLGLDDVGRPVLAMKLVKGDSWARQLGQDFPRLSAEEFLAQHLPILVQVCQAVAFAHSRGIIHRDLKPSQIMVGEFGEVLVMDWGLSHVFDYERAGFRMSMEAPPLLRFKPSSPAGTPAYMAPEQTEKEPGELGPRTDVYLLGGILYNMLTGKAPHHAKTSSQAFAAARDGRVVPPSEITPGRMMPDDLVELCVEALSPDPGKRPASAEEFLERVRDYLTGSSRRLQSEQLLLKAAAELETASDYEMFSRVQEKLRSAQGFWPGNPDLPALHERVLSAYARHALMNNDLAMARAQARQLIPGSAAQRDLLGEVAAAEQVQRRRDLQRRIALAAVALLLLVLGGGILKYSIDQSAAAERLRKERDRSVEARRSAESAESEAIRQKEIAEGALHRAEEEQYFSAIGIADVSIAKGEISKARDLLFDKTPAAFRQWEWGYEVAQLFPEDMSLLNQQQMFDADYSPDGSRIVTGDLNNVTIWDAHTGQQIWKVRTNDKVVWSTVFSPDGMRILASSYDKTAVLLNAEDGGILHRFSNSAGILRIGTFSPDGKVAATACADNRVRLYSVETGELIHEIPTPEIPYMVSYSPDGRLIAAAVLGGNSIIYDAKSYSVVRHLEGHDGNVTCARFTPDGAVVATTCGDRGIRLYDAQTGELKREETLPDSFGHSVSFSPDGRMLAVADDRGYAHVWDLSTFEPLGEVLADDPMWKLHFSPDGEHLLTASRRSVRVFSLDRILHHASIDPQPSAEVVASTSESLRVFGLPESRDAAWRRAEAEWSTPTGVSSVTRAGEDFLVFGRYAAYSPDRTIRVETSEDSWRASVVDARTGDVVKRLETGDLLYTTFSPDGSLFAAAEMANVVRLYDPKTWEKVADLNADPEGKAKGNEVYYVHSIRFSPDGKLLAVGYLNSIVALWDLGTKKIVRTMDTVNGTGVSLAFSPDGGLLASGSREDNITVWNSATGKVAGTLVGHRRTVYGLRFSPDGKRLVSVSSDTTAKLWDLASMREVLTLYSSPEVSGRPLAAAFTRDGRQIMIATADRRFLVYETFPWDLSELPGDPETLTLDQRLEWWKRHRLESSISAKDIVPPAID